VARPITLIAALSLFGAIAACSGDARFKRLSVGISRDSAIQLIGAEKPRRVDPFLVNGHYFEVMYYAKPGADTTTLTDRKMSPVVVVDGKLVGWGWESLDSVAGANKIPVAGKQ